MAYINIEVDLDEFDLDELTCEIEERYERGRKESEKIEGWVSEYFGKEPKGKTLLDNLKIELLLNNLDKISLNDLENIIRL